MEAEFAAPLVACGAPVLRFGAIADVQYADVEDAPNFVGTAMRRYRGALSCLQAAVADWADDGSTLDFVADLGDIIDQQCESRGDSHEMLGRVLREWELVTVPVQRAIGNHELYNFSREECARLLPGIVPWYRRAWMARGCRVLVLDSYDVSMIERGAASDEGINYLSQFNSNDLRAPRGTEDLSAGLRGLARRFVPMSGAFRDTQLRWLAAELHAARSAGEQVVVLSHVPLHPGATVAGALLWNYEEALAVLEEAGAGVVALVLAGHYHPGGYVRDASTGTHHVTLPSPLNASPEDPRAHCIIEIWDKRIEIIGRGLVPSYSLPIGAVDVPPARV